MYHVHCFQARWLLSKFKCYTILPLYDGAGLFLSFGFFINFFSKFGFSQFREFLCILLFVLDLYEVDKRYRISNNHLSKIVSLWLFVFDSSFVRMQIVF
ncbi:hypothetical protein Hanom_Chr11g00974781 [Helianthus anomalus]